MGGLGQIVGCGALLLASACSFDTSVKLGDGDGDGESDASSIIDASVISDAADTVSFDANVTPGEPDASPEPTTGTLYSFPRNDVDVVIDGILSSGWQEGSFVEFAIENAELTVDLQTTYVSSATVRMASMYDSEKIYFFLEVQDDNVVDNNSLSEDDSIELYFDGGDDGQGPYEADDFWMMMAPRVYGTVPSAVTVDGWSRTTETGYNLEFSFLRSSLGDSTRLTHGFNIGINDNDGIGDSQVDQYGLWHLPTASSTCTACCNGGEKMAWCDTTRLGQLVLMP